jgi:hypothetical protein
VPMTNSVPTPLFAIKRLGNSGVSNIRITEL